MVARSGTKSVPPDIQRSRPAANARGGRNAGYDNRCGMRSSIRNKIARFRLDAPIGAMRQKARKEQGAWQVQGTSLARPEVSMERLENEFGIDPSTGGHLSAQRPNLAPNLSKSLVLRTDVMRDKIIDSE